MRISFAQTAFAAWRAWLADSASGCAQRYPGRRERQPDVALIEVDLVGSNGYQIVLRDTPRCNDMVLIALSSHVQADSLRRSREAGFDDYVAKAIGPDCLVRLVDVTLAAKTRRHTGQAPS